MKLKKTLSTGKYTDYEEDEIYENNILYQTAHDEGRIVNGVFEYFITDHLGNMRVAFKDSAGVAKVTQENHTGAWGEELPTLSYQNTPKTNNFTYSTYEKENDFGIGVFDAHARVYDPIVPRFWQIDPLAEKFVEYSPFNFALNNPIKFADPDGAYPIIINVRSFAPFESFGFNNWLGDHRGFTTSSRVTSRLRQETTYETTTSEYSTKAFGSVSTAIVNPLFPSSGSLVAKSEASCNCPSGKGK